MKTATLSQFLVPLLMVALLPSVAEANVTHKKIINMAGCRSVFLSTSAPFSDYMEYDNSGSLYDYATQNPSAQNTNSQLICDFGLESDSTVVSLDSVVLVYGNTSTSNYIAPQLSVIVTSNHSGVWNTSNVGPCIGTAHGAAITDWQTCSQTVSQSWTQTGYTNFAAYAVINWVAETCTGNCSNWPRIYRLEVNYTATN